MQDIKYKKYNKDQMLKIIENEPFVFVETDLGDNYIIRKRDISDFIILENMRTGHKASMKMWFPGFETPSLTTCGWFLDRINQKLRAEIIERLVLLQTTDTKPKKVKIFDNDIFIKLTPEEQGIVDGKVKYFNKFYMKYVKI